jgi:hypothetical protein
MTLGSTMVGSVGLEALAGELQGPDVLGDGSHDMVGGPSGDLGLNFEGDDDLGADDAGEVGDDLLGDASCVAAEARGVEGDGAVEPPGPGGFGWRGPQPGYEYSTGSWASPGWGSGASGRPRGCAVTVPSAAMRWVSACLTCWGSRLRTSLSARMDSLGEVLAGGLVEVLEAGLVGGEEDDRVAVEPRGVAARLEDGPGGDLGGAGGHLAVGVIDAEDDQAGVEVVGDVEPRRWQGMDPAEVPPCCGGHP